MFVDGFFRTAQVLKVGGRLADQSLEAVEILSIDTVADTQDIACIALESGNGYFVRSPGGEQAFLVREALTGKQLERKG